jgi:hypothetical protein
MTKGYQQDSRLSKGRGSTVQYSTVQDMSTYLPLLAMLDQPQKCLCIVRSLATVSDATTILRCLHKDYMYVRGRAVRALHPPTMH